MKEANLDFLSNKNWWFIRIKNTSKNVVKNIERGKFRLFEN